MRLELWRFVQHEVLYTTHDVLQISRLTGLSGNQLQNNVAIL